MLTLVFVKSIPINSYSAGGAEVYVHEVSRKLVEKYCIDVIVVSSSESARAGTYTIDGVKYVLSRASSRHAFLSIAPYILRKLIKKLLEEGRKVIVVDEYTTCPFMTTKYLKNVPIILLVHQLSYAVVSYQYKLPKEIVRSSEAMLLRPYLGTTCITVSPSVAMDLHSMGFKRVQIAEPGTPVKPLRDVPEKTNYPLITCVSRYVPYKRLEHIVYAAYIVRKYVPRFRVVIIGRGSHKYLAKLMNLVKKLNLGKYVKLLYNVPLRQKLEILRRSWLHVMTSVYEGFNLAVLEAAACGTPTLAYAVHGLIDSVTYIGGYLLSDQDYEKLASAICSLISSPDDLFKRAEVCLGRVKYLTWERTAEKLRNVIRKVMTEG